MPSFFEAMKRMIQGKPVFDTPERPQEPQVPGAQPITPATPRPTAPVTPLNTIKKGVDSTFPVVYIKRTSTRINGRQMQVYCRIMNSFHATIALDKIRILNTTRELDCDLRPGEEREFQVYSGPVVTNQQREAKLDYKTQREGDYFEAIHDVTFIYHPDKTYTVDEIKLHMPIRDIYG
jgi:hypothetical protein